MQKILPINPNPYIRTYTHHGYHHAIISTPDKVSSDSHLVAQVEVKNFGSYTWSIQNEDLKYEISHQNNLNFYSNKWDTNMNTSFWRNCNDFDELEISIHKQIYSNVWATIVVFLTDNNRELMTDIDSSYIVQCGNFSKDGLYYRINTEPHTTILSSPTLPLNIKLIKKGNNISIQYYDNNIHKKEVTIIDTTEQALERIGFAINLGCNSYYEWLFSNYINFYVNRTVSMPIDYLCNLHKNWALHTNDYFLDFNTETESEINSLGFSLIEYIKQMINLNRYVEILINDNIHTGTSDVTGPYFHQNLIFGYDDILQQFHLLYYKAGRVQITTMLYNDFLSARNYLPNRKIYICKYNPGYEVYKLIPKHILQMVSEYKSSNNTSFYEPQYTTQYRFGIAGLQYLVEYEDDNILIDDIRITYLIYEHSICTRDRIEYLFFKKIISLEYYKQLYSMSIEECQLTQILVNLVIKQRVRKENDINKIRIKIKEIIEIEKSITDKLIDAITKFS